MCPAASGSSPGNGTLVLAPHPDDAAFSLGGAILGRHLPLPITVMSLFSRSNYAWGRFHADVDRVTALRRAEDEQWARDAGVRLIWLDYPEAALRIGSSFVHVFGPADFGHSVVNEVSSRIQYYIEGEKPGLLVAPLGIGNHCDHVLVRELAKNLSRCKNVVTAFYEDLPYAHEAPREEFMRAVLKALQHPHRVVLSLRCGEIDRKCASLFCYATQVEDAVVRAVRQHSLSFGCTHGAECLWLSAADSHHARTLA